MANENLPNTRTLNMPWQSLVTRADPDWQRAQHDQVQYEFSGGRVFRHDPTTRGAYGT